MLLKILLFLFLFPTGLLAQELGLARDTNGLWGIRWTFKNKNTWLIAPKYAKDSLELLRPHYWIAQSKGKYGLMEPYQERIFLPFVYDSLYLPNYHALVFAKQKGQWTVLNGQLKTLYTELDSFVYDYHREFYWLYRKGKIGILNELGKTLAEPIYEAKQLFPDYADRSLFGLKQNGRWGLYHAKNYQQLLAPDFDTIQLLGSRDLFVLKQNGRWGLYHAQDSLPFFVQNCDSIVYFNYYTVSILKAGLVGLVEYRKGQYRQVLPVEYAKIRLEHDVVFSQKKGQDSIWNVYYEGYYGQRPWNISINDGFKYVYLCHDCWINKYFDHDLFRQVDSLMASLPKEQRLVGLVKFEDHHIFQWSHNGRYFEELRSPTLKLIATFESHREQAPEVLWVRNHFGVASLYHFSSRRGVEIFSNVQDPFLLYHISYSYYDKQIVAYIDQNEKGLYGLWGVDPQQKTKVVSLLPATYDEITTWNAVPYYGKIESHRPWLWCRKGADWYLYDLAHRQFFNLKITGHPTDWSQWYEGDAWWASVGNPHAKGINKPDVAQWGPLVLRQDTLWHGVQNPNGPPLWNCFIFSRNAWLTNQYLDGPTLAKKQPTPPAPKPEPVPAYKPEPIQHRPRDSIFYYHFSEQEGLIHHEHTGAWFRWKGNKQQTKPWPYRLQDPNPAPIIYRDKTVLSYDWNFWTSLYGPVSPIVIPPPPPAPEDILLRVNHRGDKFYEFARRMDWWP